MIIQKDTQIIWNEINFKCMQTRTPHIHCQPKNRIETNWLGITSSLFDFDDNANILARIYWPKTKKTEQHKFLLLLFGHRLQMVALCFLAFARTKAITIRMHAYIYTYKYIFPFDVVVRNRSARFGFVSIWCFQMHLMFVRQMRLVLFGNWEAKIQFFEYK